LTSETFEVGWAKALEGIGNDLMNALVDVVPVDTGRLKNSIVYNVEGDTITVEMADYGLYVEFGTAPHIIKPKNKKALHWKSGTPGSTGRGDVFAKVVHHPGTTPQPFIRNTLHNKLPGIIEDNIERQFK